MSNTAPMQVNPTLTAVAISYRNPSLIADQVLPRIPVATQEFKYLKRTQADSYTVPEAKVSRTGAPNRVETGGTLETARADDYGLRGEVPAGDIKNAPPNYNPLMVATELVSDLVALAREVRVAAKVFGASNYGAANKVTLAGADQFSDGASDPIKTIMDALDACLMRPNKGVMGRAVFSALARHPKICKAVHGNSGDAGIVTRQQLAQLFELDEILVGEAFVNSAKKGQTASMARAWGKYLALIRTSPLAGANQNAMTFGFTGEFIGKQVYTWHSNDIGAHGGEIVQVADTVAEVITADDLGYLISAAVA